MRTTLFAACLFCAACGHDDVTYNIAQPSDPAVAHKVVPPAAPGHCDPETSGDWYPVFDSTGPTLTVTFTPRPDAINSTFYLTMFGVPSGRKVDETPHVVTPDQNTIEVAKADPARHDGWRGVFSCLPGPAVFDQGFYTHAVEFDGTSGMYR